MACASQAMISANTCTFNSPRLFKKYQNVNERNLKLFPVRASSDDSDCNTDECAPEKEVSLKHSYFNLLFFWLSCILSLLSCFSLFLMFVVHSFYFHLRV